MVFIFYVGWVSLRFHPPTRTKEVFSNFFQIKSSLLIKSTNFSEENRKVPLNQGALFISIFLIFLPMTYFLLKN